MSYPIASELSYLVLQKQRTDPEVTGTPLHEPRQVRQPRLDREEFQTRFSADDFAWTREIPVSRETREIPVGRYWKHGR